MLPTMFYDLIIATGETLYMVIISTLIATLLGLPLGTWLFICTKVRPHLMMARMLTSFINITRSIPFIILLVALIPFTRLVVGTSIGIHAAMVPLTLGAMPFFARMVENVYQRLPAGLIETGHSMGATTRQMIMYILLPEALPGIIHAITITAITLVNYSAMAGTVGGGGLGDLAIRYGYQRFNVSIMVATVAILVVIVQLIQMLGDHGARHYSRGEH